MIQIKEFIDSDTSLAERLANEFLSSLQEDQVIDIRYGSFVKKHASNHEYQRSAILVIYKTEGRLDSKAP